MTRVNKQLVGGAVINVAAGLMVYDGLRLYWSNVVMPGWHWGVFIAAMVVGVGLWETSQGERHG